ERPAVVAVEIAFPFGEQVRNDGMELARLYARPDIRVEPSAHRPADHRKSHARPVGVSLARHESRVWLHIAAFLRVSRKHRNRQALRRRRGWNPGDRKSVAEGKGVD